MSGPWTYKKEFRDILHELGRDTTQKSGKHELILVILYIMNQSVRYLGIAATLCFLSNSVGGLGA